MNGSIGLNWTIMSRVCFGNLFVYSGTKNDVFGEFMYYYVNPALYEIVTLLFESEQINWNFFYKFIWKLIVKQKINKQKYSNINRCVDSWQWFGIIAWGMSSNVWIPMTYTCTEPCWRSFFRVTFINCWKCAREFLNEAI